ncbi:MAG TPA: putative cobaltochelatase [Mycobacteriales bacterium]|nr:putative cobaltochelatase [Mycobacteriales bacterium]
MSAYPFSAVVGLDDLRLALVVNAVSPSVGGVLVRGEKGTAKSTVVRALAALLPPVAVVEGCRFSCDPAAPDPECPDGPHDDVDAASRPARLVELPVGASEDRLVGSLDLERALTEGVRAYEPGLLAQAHRGVLYVDEVNLLHDHLVDLLLDAAALGTSYVEREGVSVRHAARFLLVGTMNPEEGELRPQLLDRFGLTVEVRATRDPVERAEVVRRRMAYEADPAAFAAQWQQADADLAGRIAEARARLPKVVLGDQALREVTTVCAAFDVDGLRADLVTAKAAVALAAWAGRDEVTTEDVRTAARLALPHRRRRTPFEAPGLDDQQLEDALSSVEPEEDPDGGPDDDGGGPDGGAPDSGGPGSGTSADTPSEQLQDSDAGQGEQQEEQPAPAGASGERTETPGTPFRAVTLQVPGVNRRAGAAGRRSRAQGGSGKLTGARRPAGRLHALHLSATLRAAAPFQRARGRTGTGVVLRSDDLREAVREGREGNLVLFVVDASGSMAARSRTAAVKGAVLSLLLDAYQRRDKVGLITFRGTDAELALPPTSSVEAAAARLTTLPTGGRTPLSAGLLRAAEVLRVEALRDAGRRALVVVVTDGRHTSGPAPELAAAHLVRTGAACVVVDCESGPVRLGLAAELGEQLGGVALRLEELSAESLTAVARSTRTAA